MQGCRTAADAHRARNIRHVYTHFFNLGNAVIIQSNLLVLVGTLLLYNPTLFGLFGTLLLYIQHFLVFDRRLCLVLLTHTYASADVSTGARLPRTTVTWLV